MTNNDVVIRNDNLYYYTINISFLFYFLTAPKSSLLGLNLCLPLLINDGTLLFFIFWYFYLKFRI